ncbi:MAG: hypothetical protein KGP14_13055 [Betaproteobacteria bacterium]|nr:hypothetical protein [Betaproteobacteria bacterium]
MSAGHHDPFDLFVGLDFHQTIDFDKRSLRKSMRLGAADVRKEARRLVSRRAISAPGEMPGQQSGALKRAIGIVSRGSRGGWIKVGVRSIPGSAFYPAFLFYGSPKTGLDKRGNFMVAALNNRRSVVRGMIRGALRESLKPR